MDAKSFAEALIESIRRLNEDSFRVRKEAFMETQKYLPDIIAEQYLYIYSSFLRSQP